MRLAPKITSPTYSYPNASALAALITVFLFTAPANAVEPIIEIPPPTIETIVEPQTLTEGVSANIWVEDVSSPGTILQVEVEITRPDGRTSVNNILGGVSPGVYEVDYHGFFYPGEYQLSVTVSDQVSTASGTVVRESEPAITTVTQLNPEFQNDSFEPDDTPADATWFGINVGLHSHSFSTPTDEDWILIYAEDFDAGNLPDQKKHRNEVEI
jgi:hypothetical protein